MSLDDYHLLLLISEDEMWEKRNANPNAKGVPEFYAVAKNGRVWFYPILDPEKCTLMCKEGVV